MHLKMQQACAHTHTHGGWDDDEDEVCEIREFIIIFITRQSVILQAACGYF